MSATDWYGRLTAPRAVAVIGATDDLSRPGGRVTAYLLRYGFPGPVYPVNPNRPAVQGMPCLSSVEDAPGPVDLAVVLVPAGEVGAALEACGRAGVPVAVVGSAGFSETGDAGAALERRMRDIASSAGIRLVGPNTNGVVVGRSRLAASFTPVLDDDSLELADAPCAIVSQSGALGAALFAMAHARGLAVGTLFNSGNEIDVSFEELVERLVEELPAGGVVLGYLEGLADARRFVGAAGRAARRGVALAVLKVGRTASGAHAAAAHTAKLAGNDRVYRGVLRQIGAVRADSLGHLVDVGALLRAHPAPVGKRVSVASLSGGLGIILADLLESAGLRVPSWDAQARRRLDGLLPPHLSRHNPIDLAGSPFYQPDRLAGILRAMDAHAGTDVNVLAVANVDRLGQQVGAAVAGLAPDLRKPLIVVWLGGGGDAPGILRRAGIPCFPDAEQAVAGLSALVHRRTPTLGRAAARARGPGAYPPDATARELLVRYGVPVVDEVRVPLGRPAPPLDFPLPVVAKLASDDLVHKSDVGAVRPHLATPDDLDRALRELGDLARRLGLADAEVAVQRQMPAGLELLLGTITDPTFGPVVTLGFGGVLAEAFDDVAVRLPDLSEDDVADMVAELRHQALVVGLRHLPPLTAPRVAPVVLAFARLARDLGDAGGVMDVNPLILGAVGPPVAVDWLFEPGHPR